MDRASAMKLQRHERHGVKTLAAGLAFDMQHGITTVAAGCAFDRAHERRQKEV